MRDVFAGSVDHPKIGELIWLGALGGIVGAGCGVFALLFRWLIGFFHNLFFNGTLSWSYNPLNYPGESTWGIGVIFVPVVGALAVTFLVVHFAPQARNHGVPEVMCAIYYHAGKIRWSLAFTKLFSSAISIGSGGSIGREGPIVQMCAAIGSSCGSLLKLPGRVRTVLLAAAASGGIAGSFDAPLGGILFSVELLLPAVSAASLLPVSLAAFAATLVVQPFLAVSPELPAHSFGHIGGGMQLEALPVLLLLGIAVGVSGTAFIHSQVSCEAWCKKHFRNSYIRHASAMLVVGVLFWVFRHYSGHYYISGIGYAVIYDMLEMNIVSVTLLAALLVGKFIATCLTLGSGGSGGIFCPSLFMGGALGGIFGVVMRMIFPESTIVPELFVLCGMAAFVGTSTGAVISGIIMVAEMTGRYDCLTALAFVCVISFALRRALIGGGLYTQKSLRRNSPIPEGLQSSIWSARRVRDIMSPLPPGELPPGLVAVDADTDIDKALRMWHAGKFTGILAMRNGRAAGVLTDHELGRNCREMVDRMM